jgi:adenine-specific DNA-methyltransferase
MRFAALCAEVEITFDAEIRQEDFIAAAVESLRGDLFASPLPHFDCAILNPPYRKINSDSLERRMLHSIGIETSNLYTAFLALVADLLNPGGELVAITPRSFSNGPYFRPFRRKFLESMALQHVHVFDSRDDAFRDDDVLQETVIFRAVKNGSPDVVAITSSTGPESGDERTRLVEYTQVVRPDDRDAFIRLVPDDFGSELAERMENLLARLNDLGLTVSTGRVVDFRATEFLRPEPGPDTAPLIYPNHFGASGFVEWPNPTGRKPNALARTADSEDLLVPAGTYVLVRRFSAKEERRRIVASIYDAGRVSPLPVGFENHLNYFHQNGQGVPMATAKGLAAFLNSTQLDTYFRQFNGHTQVNATDLRSLRYPSLDELVELGEQVGENSLSQLDIDWLVEGMLFGRRASVRF